MRNYEIIFLVHPDQSGQVLGMLDRYTKTISAHNGVVHRKEDWGRRALAYPINKVHKAHYVLLNVECEHEVIKELEDGFKFNDAILRYMILKRKTAISAPSYIAKHANSGDSRIVRKNTQRTFNSYDDNANRNHSKFSGNNEGAEAAEMSVDVEDMSPEEANDASNDN